MDLTVDPRSSAPPFEQLRSQVAEQARTGELAAGTRLPTVRALAERLGLAANTVARAYRELEAAGVVETRGRLGTFVAASTDARDRAAFEAAQAYVRTIRGLDLGRQDAAAWLDRAWRTPTTPS